MEAIFILFLLGGVGIVKNFYVDSSEEEMYESLYKWVGVAFTAVWALTAFIRLVTNLIYWTPKELYSDAIVYAVVSFGTASFFRMKHKLR